MAAALLCLAGTACKTPSDAKAVRLVQLYNQRVIEAFRSSDERPVEGLVGDEEAKKILGLIGVKADMGITLDAAMTEFKVLGVRRPSRDAVEVLTEERWHYRDRKIGTGETVGQESDDHYFMRYTLKKAKDRWVVWGVVFEKPPEVGRTSTPINAAPSVFHGMKGAPQPPPGREGGPGAKRKDGEP